jgi:hypothetical protein
MYAIYALFEGHFQMATFEIFESLQEAEKAVMELKSQADESTRFFIEIP